MGPSTTDSALAWRGPVPIICGPTAAGKSAMAMQLARIAPITIISADSRQLYRGFDIGTAKPSASEQRLVPHEGIDVAQPDTRWSAWQWAAMARDAIVRARALGRMPVVVGGTGFYIRALMQPLADLAPLDESRRASLSAWLDQQPAERLRQWTARLDPDREPLGPVQHRRAIEVALLTGHRLSAALADDRERTQAGEHGAPALHARYLVVDPGPALGERIARRVEQMLDDGWIDEVRALARTVPPDSAAWKATGYADVRAHVDGSLARSEMTTRVTIQTRQYAKRQRTWFRHQLPDAHVTRMSPYAPDALATASAWWKALDTETV